MGQKRPFLTQVRLYSNNQSFLFFATKTQTTAFPSKIWLSFYLKLDLIASLFIIERLIITFYYENIFFLLGVIIFINNYFRSYMA